MALAQTTDTTPLAVPGEQRGGVFSAWISRHSAILILAVLLLILPAVASSFILDQIVGWALILGMIALSLMLLAGYGGMVSLVQMTVAGVAGYMITVFGASSLPAISLFWPWWAAAPIAIIVAVAFGTLAGALSARTEGIYTIMITLALATAFFYLTLQNWPIFNGFNGFTTIPAPHFLGVNWRATIPFFYMVLFFAALSYVAVVFPSQGPFRPRPAGRRRQPPPHGGDRLQRHRPPHRRLCVCGVDRGGRRNLVGVAEQSDLAFLGRRRRRHQYPDYRRGRRPQPSNRSVHR